MPPKSSKPSRAPKKPPPKAKKPSASKSASKPAAKRTTRKSAQVGQKRKVRSDDEDESKSDSDDEDESDSDDEPVAKPKRTTKRQKKSVEPEVVSDDPSDEVEIVDADTTHAKGSDDEDEVRLILAQYKLIN